MISSYAVDDITILKWEGDTDYNEPEDATPIDVKGYIEYKTKLLSGKAGDDVVAGTKGMMVSSALIRFPLSIENALERVLMYQDILKFNGVEHAILKIDKPKAFFNPFYEVWVA